MTASPPRYAMSADSTPAASPSQSNGSSMDTTTVGRASHGRKVALVTGVTGQDGSYLVELLLAKGYEVHGLKRRSSSFNHPRLQHLLVKGYPFTERLHLHYGDLCDANSLRQVLREVMPDEVYNLAAQSHVKASFELPEYTGQASGLGVMSLLEAVRCLGLGDTCRVYQASTSELYGKVHEVPQSEETPFHPRSPYGVAKLYAFWAIKNYREAYGMYACNGILFNHESPRRGEAFVTRKITKAVVAIHLGKEDYVLLGNLDAERDWGHARDYVEAMWMMLQQPVADDYVIATGETTTVRRFCEMAFARLGMPLRWEGVGIKEVGIVTSGPRAGQTVVCVDEKYFRPAEVDQLLGNPAKAMKQLGWMPLKTTVEQLCHEMVDSDLALAEDPTSCQHH